MKRLKEKLMICLCLSFVSSLHSKIAYVYPSDAIREETQKMAMAKLKLTEKDPISKESIEKLVNELAILVQKEGVACIDMYFRGGENNKSIISDTYAWINTISEAITLVHPVNYKLEGRSMSTLKDINGKAFFVEMCNLAKTIGEGWIFYSWPKPGETTPSEKATYFKRAGDDILVACGTYDKKVIDEIKRAQIKK